VFACFEVASTHYRWPEPEVARSENIRWVDRAGLSRADARLLDSDAIVSHSIRGEIGAHPLDPSASRSFGVEASNFQ
jgi:hypothetical protein